MADNLQYATAAYMVQWTRQYGTPQQQYEAERRMRDVQRGTT